MIKNCESLTEALCEQIREHLDIAVIGLSGGADSGLTALLCSIALGKDNVFGVSMPYNENDKATFNDLSAKLAARIGINHLVRPVTAIADAINDQAYSQSTTNMTDTNKGNSRSRARMCILYGVAHDLSTESDGKRARVIGTGNLSEDFIGYDTKGGDALADIFPIGELFKSEVYQLLEYFRDKGMLDEENINRVPSAGLVDGQTDEEDLGHSYNDMEPGVRYCMTNYAQMPVDGCDEMALYIWNRHQQHKHKHEAPAVIKIRHLCD